MVCDVDIGITISFDDEVVRIGCCIEDSTVVVECRLQVIVKDLFFRIVGEGCCLKIWVLLQEFLYI